MGVVFEIKANTEILTLTASFQHYTGGPNSAIRVRKRNLKHKDWRGIK